MQFVSSKQLPARQHAKGYAMWKCQRQVLVVLALLVHAGTAHAAVFDFTNLADSLEEHYFPSSSPALNNLGQAAFYVSFGGSFQAADRVVRSSGGPVTLIADIAAFP